MSSLNLAELEHHISELSYVSGDVQSEHYTSEYIFADVQLTSESSNKPTGFELTMMWSSNLGPSSYSVPLQSTNEFLHRYKRKYREFQNRRSTNCYFVFRFYFYEIKKKYFDFSKFTQKEISKLSRIIWNNSKIRLQKYFKSFCEELKTAISNAKSEYENHCERTDISLQRNLLLSNTIQNVIPFNNCPYLRRLHQTSFPVYDPSFII
ncbi:1294_t:CDS:2 [Ambispora gerdemannii]|uniref:1294_t:CDS:1 n=1 Tax=Ambispora gerdemannii TaxID=144530 RepID=A0A9N9DKS0_9GLOM|nr:1294_t:CDS:2 [Ambispora gerdemannii]